MKLIFVVKALSLRGGGAERVLAVVTAGLAARNHEVAVASFDAPGSNDFYAFHPAVRRIRLGIGNSAERSGVGHTLRRIGALRGLITAEAPDVAIGFMHSAYVPVSLALAGTGIPTVASEHIVYEHYENRRVERLLLGITPRFLYAITAISEEMRRGFPSGIRHKMIIVPNPVEGPPGAKAETLGGAKKVLLTVGRLEPQKDHRTLIAAFGQVADRFPDWHLRIVGEGVLRPMLEAQVSELGLHERIALPGATADIASEYATAQLFVIPSTYESFGLATAEAMAQGLPAVGFADCPGTNELIIDGENGILVAGHDRTVALAEGISLLMSSDADRVRMGVAAPGGIAQYAPERVVDRWEELLLAAAAGQPAPR